MAWNIDHIRFDVIEIHDNQLIVHSQSHEDLLVSVDAEIKKAAWDRDTILVRLVNGETRKYLNHLQYVPMETGRLQKLVHSFSDGWSFLRSRAFRPSRQRYSGDLGISPSSHI